jgi:hypothetical protein
MTHTCAGAGSKDTGKNAKTGFVEDLLYKGENADACGLKIMRVHDSLTLCTIHREIHAVTKHENGTPRI